MQVPADVGWCESTECVGHGEHRSFGHGRRADASRSTCRSQTRSQRTPRPPAVGRRGHLRNLGQECRQQERRTRLCRRLLRRGHRPHLGHGTANEIGSGDVRFSPLATIAPGSTATFKIKAMRSKPETWPFRRRSRLRSRRQQASPTMHGALFYGEDGVPLNARRLLARKTTISAAAGQPARNAGGSSRKPTLQAAPSGATPTPSVAPAAPTGGIPLGGPTTTTPATPVPLTASKPAVVPAYGMPAAGPAIGTRSPWSRNRWAARRRLPP